ncbi:MAG: peptidoglycan -binding protein [Maricaulaceae bacterium]
MTAPRAIRGRNVDQGDHWPGFVDALATLLLVVVFLLSLFIASQFVLGRALTGRDAELSRLNARLGELGDLLALERDRTTQLSERVDRLRATLTRTREQAAAEAARLQSQADDLRTALRTAEADALDLQARLTEETEISEAARAEVELLNEQIGTLNAQIARLNAALEAAEERDREAQAQIVNLGQRLNAALAQRVDELARFQSEFFGKLLEALEGRADVRVVGDRFVFETDILFESASADLNPNGEDELLKIADAILQIAEEIPTDVNWIIRVDGHTDRIPIRSGFQSNWHLSAERAISVVNFFEAAGVPADRLAAAGFGEHHPIDPGGTSEALARNRRIELKLTSR